MIEDVLVADETSIMVRIICKTSGGLYQNRRGEHHFANQRFESAALNTGLGLGSTLELTPRTRYVS
jgi:hypothetical protein